MMSQAMGVVSGVPDVVVCWRTHRILHAVVLRAQIYYSKRIQSKTSQGQRHTGKVLGNLGTSSEGSFPVSSHRMCSFLPALNCDDTCNMLSTWEAYQGLRVQVFYWWLVTQTSSAWYQNSRLPEGQQVFSTNHIVGTTVWAPQPPLSVGERGEFV